MIKSDYAEAYNNLANVLVEQGQAHWPRPISCEPSPFGQTTPKHTATWATCCASKENSSKQRPIARRPWTSSPT